MLKVKLNQSNGTLIVKHRLCLPYCKSLQQYYYKSVVVSMQAATTKTHNLLQKTFAMAMFILTLFLLFNFRSEAQEFKNFDKRLNENQKEIVRLTYHKIYHNHTHMRLLSQATPTGVFDSITIAVMESIEIADSIDYALGIATQIYFLDIYKDEDKAKEAYYNFGDAAEEFDADPESKIFDMYVEDDTKNKKIFDENIKRLNDVLMKRFQEFLIDYFKKK